MMFKLPSTATTSLSWCPSIRCGNIAKWMYDGGRVRARYARPRAVADDVEAQFAVGRLGRGVDLVDRRRPAAVRHEQLEVLDQPLDAAIDRRLVRACTALLSTSTLTGPAGRFSIACSMIFRLSQHLLHADEIAGVAVAVRGADRP